MPISAVCACDAQIEAPDDLAGQSVQCPKCAAAVSIPSPRGGQRVIARAENCWEDGQVPEDLKEKALADLGPKEQLVWIGQPVGAIVFRRSLGYLVLGGVVTLVSVLWLLGAFNKAFAPMQAAAPQPGAKAPAAAPKQRAKTSVKKADMVPAIILAIAICPTLLPFYRWKMAKRTCYALTNRRALVYKQGFFGPTRESYSPVEVAQMRRRDSWVFKEGGDLIFKSVTVVSHSYSRQHGARQSVKTTHYGFLAIAQVKKVEKLVRETLIDRFVDKLNEASSW